MHPSVIFMSSRDIDEFDFMKISWLENAGKGSEAFVSYYKKVCLRYQINRINFF